MNPRIKHLNNGHIYLIKRWIKGEGSPCPFQEAYGKVPDRCKICRGIFIEARYIPPCPCVQYNMDFVKQVVNQTLKVWEKKEKLR